MRYLGADSPKFTFVNPFFVKNLVRFVEEFQKFSFYETDKLFTENGFSNYYNASSRRSQIL